MQRLFTHGADMRSNMEDFIAHVKNYPCLFDVTDVGYKDLEKMASAWQQIAEAVNMTEQECKQRWKNLRDSYVKERRRVHYYKKRGGKVKRKWLYSDLMTFLDPFLKIKETLAPEVCCSTGDVSNPSVSDHEDGIVKSIKPRPKKRLNKKLNNLFTDPIWTSVAKPQINKILDNNNQIDQDEEWYFAQSTAATMRRFSPYKKALAKAKITEMLLKIEFTPDVELMAALESVLPCQTGSTDNNSSIGTILLANS